MVVSNKGARKVLDLRMELAKRELQMILPQQGSWGGNQMQKDFYIQCNVLRQPCTHHITLWGTGSHDTSTTPGSTENIARRTCTKRRKTGELNLRTRRSLAVHDPFHRAQLAIKIATNKDSINGRDASNYESSRAQQNYIVRQIAKRFRNAGASRSNDVLTASIL